MFYHDIKEHMSPSSMEQWLRQRSAFIKTYFEGEKGPETAAMTFGTQVHALIEHGMLKVQKKWDRDEEVLKHEAGDSLFLLGKPDSFNSKVVKNTAEFVDYKTGSKSAWDDKLPTDIKMKATAWLVWMELGQPAAVIGHIEFLQTTWNEEKRELELLSDKTEISTITYQKADLEAFTDVVINTMNEINAFYEKWKDRSTEFIDDADCRKLRELTEQRDEIDQEINSLKESIESQMSFGGLMSHKIEGVGNFSISERKTYKYPDELEFKYGRKQFTLKDFTEIEKVMKASKKNYELVTEPVSVSTTMRFTPAKR